MAYKVLTDDTFADKLDALIAAVQAGGGSGSSGGSSSGTSTSTMTTVAANTAVRYEMGLYMCIPESTDTSITIKPLYGSSITAKPIAFFIYNRVGSQNPFYIDYSGTSGQWARVNLSGYNGVSPGSTPTISCSVAMRYVKIADVGA